MAEITDKLRACAFAVFPLGSHASLVKVLASGQMLVIPHVLQRMLEQCRAFASIEAHIAHIIEHFKIPPEQSHTVRGALIDLQNRGLLLPANSFVMPNTDNRTTTVPISTIAVITADRPEKLRNCLASYRACCERFDRPTELLIADDSSEPSSSHVVRDESCQGSTGCNTTRYFDKRDKERFICELVHAGCDPDVLRFMLLGEFGGGSGVSVGANRNCVLLDTVGQRIIMVDDDTLCLAATHPERADGVAFVSHEDARDVYFFDSRAAVRADMPWVCMNVLAEHEKILGVAPSSIARRFGGVSLDRACDHLLLALQCGSGSVVVTMAGVGGDSGGYSPQWLLSAHDATQRRLWSSELVFRRAMSSREIFASARRLTVSHGMSCHGAMLGVANDFSLPPFLPKYTNEDGFFGSAIGLCSTTAFLGHLPCAIFHDATPGRQYALPEFTMSVADLVISLMSFSGLHIRGGAAAGCKAVGERLQGIASLATTDFWEVVHESAARLKGEQIRMLEAAVQSGRDCPPYFLDCVRRLVASTEQKLTMSESTVPREFRSCNTLDQSKLLVQQFTKLCGRMFCAWPDVVDEAIDLRNRGIRLSRKVMLNG